ncbi:MAG: hypothetical protein FWE63_03900 [Bacteroidales bacterium]|nr:hypothetical protein [Bacteroidales bacterium]
MKTKNISVPLPVGQKPTLHPKKSVSLQMKKHEHNSQQIPRGVYPERSRRARNDTPFHVGKGESGGDFVATALSPFFL